MPTHLIEIRNAEGAGRGIYAIDDIPAGTLLMVEPSLIESWSSTSAKTGLFLPIADHTVCPHFLRIINSLCPIDAEFRKIYQYLAMCTYKSDAHRLNAYLAAHPTATSDLDDIYFHPPPHTPLADPPKPAPALDPEDGSLSLQALEDAYYTDSRLPIYPFSHSLRTAAPAPVHRPDPTIIPTSQLSTPGAAHAHADGLNILPSVSPHPLVARLWPAMSRSLAHWQTHANAPTHAPSPRPCPYSAPTSLLSRASAMRLYLAVMTNVFQLGNPYHDGIVGPPGLRQVIAQAQTQTDPLNATSTSASASSTSAVSAGAVAASSPVHESPYLTGYPGKGIFPVSALLNHSCRPNAVWSVVHPHAEQCCGRTHAETGTDARSSASTSTAVPGCRCFGCGLRVGLSQVRLGADVGVAAGRGSVRAALRRGRRVLAQRLGEGVGDDARDDVLGDSDSDDEDEDEVDCSCSEGVVVWSKDSLHYTVISSNTPFSEKTKKINETPDCVTPSLLQVRTIRPIRAGEQVCISYVDTTIAGDRRRAHLLSHYGFDCRCEACLEDVAVEAVAGGARGGDEVGGAESIVDESVAAPQGPEDGWWRRWTARKDDEREVLINYSRVCDAAADASAATSAYTRCTCPGLPAEAWRLRALCAVSASAEQEARVWPRVAQMGLAAARRLAASVGAIDTDASSPTATDDAFTWTLGSSAPRTRTCRLLRSSTMSGRIPEWVRLQDPSYTLTDSDPTTDRGLTAPDTCCTSCSTSAPEGQCCQQRFLCSNAQKAVIAVLPRVGARLSTARDRLKQELVAQIGAAGSASPSTDEDSTGTSINPPLSQAVRCAAVQPSISSVLTQMLAWNLVFRAQEVLSSAKETLRGMSVARPPRAAVDASVTVNAWLASLPRPVAPAAHAAVSNERVVDVASAAVVAAAVLIEATVAAWALAGHRHVLADAVLEEAEDRGGSWTWASSDEARRWPWRHEQVSAETSERLRLRLMDLSMLPLATSSTNVVLVSRSLTMLVHALRAAHSLSIPLAEFPLPLSLAASIPKPARASMGLLVATVAPCVSPALYTLAHRWVLAVLALVPALAARLAHSACARAAAMTRKAPQGHPRPLPFWLRAGAVLCAMSPSLGGERAADGGDAGGADKGSHGACVYAHRHGEPCVYGVDALPRAQRVVGHACELYCAGFGPAVGLLRRLCRDAYGLEVGVEAGGED